MVAKHWPVSVQPYHCAWRAQLIAESRLDSEARSHAGAEGIAQFMPGTWEEASRGAGVTGTVRDPIAAIYAGAWYMRRQLDGWTEPRSTWCRLVLAQAGYNAGYGHIVESQRRARHRGRTARCWHDGIGETLCDVTGRHCAETAGYVDRIARLTRAMTGR